MIITVFQAVATLLTLGVIGFWIVSRRIMPDQLFGPLIAISLQIALPCLIFSNIITKFNPHTMTNWWQAPLWWAAFALIAFAMAFVFSRVVRTSIRKEVMVSLAFQNGIFFPVSLLGSMYSPDHQVMIYLFLFVVFYPAFFFYLLPELLKKEKVSINWYGLINPTTMATVVAVIIVVLGLKGFIFPFVLNSLKMMGQLTIPLIFLIIGGTVYVDWKNRGKLYWKTIIKFILIKNFAFPIIFLGLLILLRPSPVMGLIIILQAAAPPVTMVPIMIEKHGGNRNLANQLLLSSFLVAMISIPFIIFLYSKFFELPM